MPKQIKAAVNTNVPTTKADITAPVMPDIDSWKMVKDVKVQYSTDRTFVAEALLLVVQRGCTITSTSTSTTSTSC